MTYTNDFGSASLRFVSAHLSGWALLSCVLLLLHTMAVHATPKSCQQSNDKLWCFADFRQPPYMTVQQLPALTGQNLARLPMMINGFEFDYATAAARQTEPGRFQPELLGELLLLTEQWFIEEVPLKLLASPATWNHHYPGILFRHYRPEQHESGSRGSWITNTQQSRNRLWYWSGQPQFQQKLQEQLIAQQAEYALLIFIGVNTLFPQGVNEFSSLVKSRHPIAQSSLPELNSASASPADYYESLAYQALLLDKEGNLLAALTEGFKLGSERHRETHLSRLNCIGSDSRCDRYHWRALHADDLSQVLDACRNEEFCAPHQAIRQIMHQLNIPLRQLQP